jgi:hypothetical protein
MKRILLIVVLCVVYDIVAFEYQRSAGVDTMFASSSLFILAAVIVYTLLLYYLTYQTTFLEDSIIRKHFLRAPIYLYIAFHAFMIMILLFSKF